MHADGGLANRRLQLRGGRFLALEELFQQDVIRLGDRLDELHTEGLGLFLQVRGNLLHVVLRAHLFVVPQDGLHLDKIDDTGKLRLGTDRDLNHDRFRTQPVANGLGRVLRVTAVLIHLVDEADTRNLVLGSLAPDRFRLGLHTSHRVKAGDRAVQDAQRTLHLGGKIHVAGGIDNVDADAVPRAGGGGGGNGDTALLLLLHPVHGGGTFMHFADAVVHTGVEENALRRGGFTGIDVGHDADVAALVERDCAGHGVLLFCGS